MKPDDEMLARWVEDELEGGDREAVERWASGEPEWLERREHARAARRLLGGTLVADEEVPHAEFFNARIRREIEVRVETPAAAPARRPHSPRPGIWAWLVPLSAAAAALVLGVWIGRSSPESGAGGALIAAPSAELAPVLYTPERGVKAEVMPAEDATVIVLAGVEALPDSWDLPDTAALERDESGLEMVDGGR